MTVTVTVIVSTSMPVGLNRVNVCLESLSLAVFMFWRRVWAVLATRFIVGIKKAAARASLPDMVSMAVGVGEGSLGIGGGRREV